MRPIDPYVHTTSPTQSGLYLKLRHGRSSPDKHMGEWGTDGPWIGPLQYLSCAYNATWFLQMRNGPEIAFDQCPQPHGDLILFDGVYYGDWNVYMHEGA